MTGALRKKVLTTGLATLVALLLASTGSALPGVSVASAQEPYELPAYYTPQSISFGKVKVGNSSDVTEVQLTKRRTCIPVGGGHYDCGFYHSDVAVSGPFTITFTNCAEFGGFCTVLVKFEPTRRGRQEGFLRLDSNPIVGVPLKGKGCRKVKRELRCWRKGAR